jgi:hypothetical protein
MTDDTTLPTPLDTGRRQVSTLDRLADIPEEEIWLQKQKSARTRRAYRLDVQHFMRTLSITTPGELRQADHKAVIAWERFMRETEHAASSTIRRRLAALSTLYKHLVRDDHATRIRSARSNGRRSIATKARPWPSPKRRRVRCWMRRRRTRSPACAIGRSSPSDCRSDCGAPRSLSHSVQTSKSMHQTDCGAPEHRTAERGHPTAGAGRNVAGIGRQLRPQHIHRAPRHPRSLTYYIKCGRFAAMVLRRWLNLSKKVTDGAKLLRFSI